MLLVVITSPSAAVQIAFDHIYNIGQGSRGALLVQIEQGSAGCAPAHEQLVFFAQTKVRP
jgi:hypothetical protein